MSRETPNADQPSDHAGPNCASPWSEQELARTGYDCGKCGLELAHTTSTSSEYQNVGIIGYSGGGVIAMLIAALNKNTDIVVTVAANLDHKAWATFHGVSILRGSLDIDIEDGRLRHITQWHFWGGEDDIVPIITTQKMVEKARGRNNITCRVFSDYDHECCWVAAWTGILGSVIGEETL